MGTARLPVFTGLLMGSCLTIACSSSNSGDRIKVSGNIELTEVKAAFKISGKLVELHAKEGTLVSKGMVLARLDDEQIRRMRGRDHEIGRAHV